MKKLSEGFIMEDVKPNPKLEWVRKKAIEAQQRLTKKAAETPQQWFLPGIGEDVGAMPNHINRSSLFAPIARGRRKFHRQTVMVTRSDCVLEYTGEQLDEADADLVMALIYYAHKYPLGTPVPLHRYDLLRKIGRTTGKHDYEWLHRRVKALTEATLFLEVKKQDGSLKYSVGKTMSFRIIAAFVYNDETEQYHYILDPRWVRMFGNREYSMIDWDRRLAIRRCKDMAKALQRLVATSSDTVQYYALDWLQAKLSYTGRMRDFRGAVTSACAELQRVGVIAGAGITDSTRGLPQLTIWLNRDRDSVALVSG